MSCSTVNCSSQYVAFLSTPCDVTVAVHQGNETSACQTERDLALSFTVASMQDLKRQYEELMDRLESLKTKSRNRSKQQKRTPSTVARTPCSTSDSEDKGNVAKPVSQTPFERIGDAVFDVEFLERCQQCLLMQRTDRQRGACNEHRIKELAGLHHVVSAMFLHTPSSETVTRLQNCLREFIARTKIFVDSCSRQSRKVSRCATDSPYDMCWI